MMIKKFKFYGWVIIIVLSFINLKGLFDYFFFTTNGAKTVAEAVLNHFVSAEQIKVESVGGTLKDGVVLKNLEIKGLGGLPARNVIRVQELTLYVRSVGLKKYDVSIINGRLAFPYTEPILFSGKIKDKDLALAIFTKSFDLRWLPAFFPRLKSFPLPMGVLDQADFKVNGTLEAPSFRGTASVASLAYRKIFLSDGPAEFFLNLDRRLNPMGLNGHIHLLEGNLKVRGIPIHVRDGKVSFTGDYKKPTFIFKGDSTIGDVKINIDFRGTKDNPELTLNSNPPLSQQRLMLMLATGRSWQSLDLMANSDKISPDVASDFLDYLLLGESGLKWAEDIGIKEVWVTMDKDRRGVGVKKIITNNVDVGYELDQMLPQQTSPATQTQTLQPNQKEYQQKVLGDVKVTNKVSVGVEKELKSKSGPEQTEQTLPNDKVLLKYKTKF